MRDENKWTSKKVCQFFEVSRSALSKWRQLGCPGGREGYDIFKVFKWYRTNIMGSPGAETTLAAEKLSYATSRAKMKLLELKKNGRGSHRQKPTSQVAGGPRPGSDGGFLGIAMTHK
jgi:hypothetical protein